MQSNRAVTADKFLLFYVRTSLVPAMEVRCVFAMLEKVRIAELNLIDFRLRSVRLPRDGKLGRMIYAVNSLARSERQNGQ